MALGRHFLQTSGYTFGHPVVGAQLPGIDACTITILGYVSANRAERLDSAVAGFSSWCSSVISATSCSVRSPVPRSSPH
jgi:hypothetical protein